MTTTAKPIIYGLADPKSKKLKYIGTTTQTLTRQLSQHLRDDSSHALHAWLRHLHQWGMFPEIFEIERVAPGDDWHKLEQCWRTYFKGIGADLLNR